MEFVTLKARFFFFLPKSPKPFFKIQQKIVGICRVFCVLMLGSYDLWMDDCWKLSYTEEITENRGFFFTYLFPKPAHALHLILAFHIDPIVALPGESYVLTSNIRKRNGQSKMRKCSCHFISCHISLKTMNTF